MYFPSWEKISKLDHYRRSALVILTISTILSLLFWCIGFPPELTSSELFFKIFSFSSFLAHMLSSVTYIGGTIDLFLEKNPEKKKESTIERWVTLTFIVLGLSCGTVLSLLLTPVTFFSFISTTTAITGSFSGIGSRLGGLGRRPALEKAALLVFMCIGLGLSLWLVATHLPFVHIANVITFITGNLIINPIYSSVIFISLFTSVCMSGADYFSKAVIYILNLHTQHTCTRQHEYRGSFLGSLLSAAAVLYLITHLHVLAGTLALGSIALTIATTTGIIAKCFGMDGIWSRVGRTLDKLFEKNDTLSEKIVKVIFVVPLVGGLMVIADIGYQIKNYLLPAKQLTPTPSTYHNSQKNNSGRNLIFKSMPTSNTPSSKTSPQSSPLPLSPLSSNDRDQKSIASLIQINNRQLKYRQRRTSEPAILPSLGHQNLPRLA